MVALALIPEAIAFSVIAGVDPRVGLFSSVILCVAIAFTGGRPAMISAATAAVALVVAPIMREHGFDYFIATVILGGVIQIALGLLGVAKLMRFIPRSVMTGFVNALAILMTIAQLPHILGAPWQVFVLIATGLAVIVLFPKLTRAVPAPLIAIIVVTVVALTLHFTVPTVGEQGELPDQLPQWFVPQVPLNIETLTLIGPTAFAMALVGLMESLMTAKLIDDVTDSDSNKTRESVGQGISNILSCLFGGMGGCAVVGQSMMNVKTNGARSRVSTFLAGVFLLILCLALEEVVGMIPMAALVAVMLAVAAMTFDWRSVTPAHLRRIPVSETLVMLATVVPVVLTENLAIGVVCGVITASLIFVRRVAHFQTVTRELHDDRVHYRVTGELFFASSNDLTTEFLYDDDPAEVIIDLSAAHVWDASTVAALDAIVHKYESRNKRVTLTGMNQATQSIHDRLSENAQRRELP